MFSESDILILGKGQKSYPPTPHPRLRNLSWVSLALPVDPERVQEATLAGFAKVAAKLIPGGARRASLDLRPPG